jgi:hypothetical protein
MYEMTKKQAKKLIWEPISEQEKKEGQDVFKERMRVNDDVVAMLKERSEKFKPKPNKPPTLPTMQEFLLMSQLHKIDHKDTILLFQWLWEQFVVINNQLAVTLQYLDDNIHNVADKTNTKLSEMKTNIADMQKKATALFGMTEENKSAKEWRKATEGKPSYVS